MREFKEWVMLHKVKFAAFMVVMMLIAAATALGTAPDGKWEGGHVIGAMAAVGVIMIFLAEWKADHARPKPTGSGGGLKNLKLMAATLAIVIGTQPARAFDQRMVNPPRPPLREGNTPQPQGVGPAVGIGVMVGGGFFVYWLVKKCQRHWGTNGQNRLDHRFDGADDSAALQNGVIYYSCDKRPRLADLEDGQPEEDLQPIDDEVPVELSGEFKEDGTANLTGFRLTPKEETGTTIEWEESMRGIGLRPDGRGHGEQSFSRGGQPIDYYDSRIYFDWDGAAVVLTEDGYYPSDVVTVEEASEVSGPWIPVLRTRIQRGARLSIFTASEGGRTFYRMFATADQ